MKRAFFQLHAAVFLAGFTAILGKLILLNEGLLVWYRLLLTVMILGVIMAFKKELRSVPFEGVLKISRVGLILTIHWVCFYGSIKYANASVALVCLSASGFFSAIFEPLIAGKKIVIAELLIGLVSIAGVYLIFDFHPQFKLGIIFGIISTMASALLPIYNKQLLEHYPHRVIILYELGSGLLILTMLLPFYLSQFHADYYLPTVTDWGWLLILAYICSVVAFDLQFNALKKVSAFTANLTYNLEPVYGVIMAFVFFHENEAFHNQFYYGLALILGAVFLQMMRVFNHHKIRNTK